MDDKHTVKERILSVLEEMAELYGVPFFYGTDRERESFPYFRYNFGHQYSKRLSNDKAIKQIWYQLEMFTTVPYDVEAEGTLLYSAEQKLERKGLFTTDWLEIPDDDNQTRGTVYRYMMEVRR